MYYKFYAELTALMDVRSVCVRATPILEVSLLRLAKVAVEKEAALITQFGQLNTEQIYFAFTNLSASGHKTLSAYLKSIDDSSVAILHHDTYCYAICVDKLRVALFAYFDQLPETEWVNYQQATLEEKKSAASPVKHLNLDQANLAKQLQEISQYCQQLPNNPQLDASLLFLTFFESELLKSHLSTTDVQAMLVTLERKLKETLLLDHLMVKNYLETFKHFLNKATNEVPVLEKNFLIPLAQAVGRMEERNKPKPGLLSSLWGASTTATDSPAEKTGLAL